MGNLSNATINGVSYDFKDAGAARQSHSHTKSQITDFPTSMPASDVSAWAKASTKPTYTASEVGAIATTAKGAASGVAELDANGKVPTTQLPSFVDDVLEYSAKSSFPSTGETGKIYVDTTTNKTYRWSGSAYVEISESLALGETSSTAYRGDRGKAAYDHSQTTSGNPHNVTKSDVGLENVGNFKAVSTVASQGLSDTEKANARANIGAGTSSFSGSYNDLSNKPTSLPASDVYSWAKASSKPSYTASEVGAVPNTAAGVSAAINQLTTDDSAPTDNDYYVAQYAGGGTSTTTYHRRPVSKLWEYIKSKLASKGSATQPVYFSNGVPVATTYTLGKSVPADAKFTDTTYSAATTSAAGLMSAADKTKLNGIATGAQVNSITGVKGNAESSYRTGNVNLTPANIGAAATSDVAVTANIAPATFATFNGVVAGDYTVCCINKHGKHITGFIMCREFDSAPETGSLAFTVNSGYRPSVSQVNILFILNEPYVAQSDGSIAVGYIKSSGYCYCPSDYITKGFTILLDYFTA